MLIRNFGKFKQNLKTASNNLFIFPNNPEAKCFIQTGDTVFKRYASIHTRHILIQKARLEHVSNFGVLLLVNVLPYVILVSLILEHQLNCFLFQAISSHNLWLGRVANQKKVMEGRTDCEFKASDV